MLAAVSGPPLPWISMATNGNRSALATVRTIPDSIARGSWVFSSRDASRDTTRYGSLVKPNSLRLTTPCRIRSGPATTSACTTAARNQSFSEPATAGSE